jgi:hypothetical protein
LGCEPHNTVANQFGRRDTATREDSARSLRFRGSVFTREIEASLQELGEFLLRGQFVSSKAALTVCGPPFLARPATDGAG